MENMNILKKNERKLTSIPFNNVDIMTILTNQNNYIADINEDTARNENFVNNGIDDITDNYNLGSLDAK